MNIYIITISTSCLYHILTYNIHEEEIILHNFIFLSYLIVIYNLYMYHISIIIYMYCMVINFMYRMVIKFMYYLFDLVVNTTYNLAIIFIIIYLHHYYCYDGVM